jgi:hypothetical protein
MQSDRPFGITTSCEWKRCAAYHRAADNFEARAMKKPLQLVVSLSALVAYAAIVCAGYFHARAEIANEACGVECSVQRVDASNKKD